MWNRLLRLLWCVACLMVVESSMAQLNSPFSRFGIGEITTPHFTKIRGMGGVATGFRSFSEINWSNPASYGAFYQPITITLYDTIYIDSMIFDEGQQKMVQHTYLDSIPRDSVIGRVKCTSFQTGISGEILNLTDQNDQLRTFSSSLGYIAMGIPIPKFGGLSFGLMPYSSVHYDLLTRENTQDTMIGLKNTRLMGNGGLFRFYGGTAVNIGNLSLGVNLSYIFGSMNRVGISYFPDQKNSLGTRYTIAQKVRGLSYDFGVQYRIEMNDDYRLDLGISGKPGTSVSAEIDTVWDRVIFIQDELFSHVDTVHASLGVPGKLRLPAGINAGIVVSKEENWLIGADLGMDFWGETPGFLANSPQADSWHLALGGELTPDMEGNFLQRSRYRFGFYINQTNLVINNHQVQDLGITFGLGIPVRVRGNLPSYVDLAFKFGREGSLQSNLLMQNYFNFSLGFNLNDQNWIQKSKFN